MRMTASDARAPNTSVVGSGTITRSPVDCVNVIVWPAWLVEPLVHTPEPSFVNISEPYKPVAVTLVKLPGAGRETSFLSW